MQRKSALAAAVILLLWLAFTVCHGEDAAASSSTAYVAAAGASDGYSSLLAAFKNQDITKVVLATNYTVAEEFEPYADQPVPIER
jgi:hypothetical protein